eukprot:CAMPEP_0174832754 /NCGR_PEP_ID=MMETSP1114-20130205/3838_1 /TAXON_ID=312471 /ORGANISM="Neobodo designis, Strain CCAP 1951/1" /LENGTH=286 /DNA_ID=CAMNT_0016066619 /DNA_START=100 /DNA_END=961 /DNA_ORIENTATION=-
MGRESFFKLIIIGPPTVGKTSMVHRFSDDTFVQNRQTTLGCDFKMKVLEHAPVVSAASQAKASDAALRDDVVSESFVEGAMRRKAFTLQLWDIAGQDRTVSLVRSFFAGAMGVVVVCDGGRESSIAEALKWRAIVDEAGVTFRGTDTPVPVVLAVNKCDLLPGEGKLSKNPKAAELDKLGAFAPPELDRICRENRMVGWVYCSARTGMNVDDVFRASIDSIVDTSIRVNLGPQAPVPVEQPGTRNLSERGARRKRDNEGGARADVRSGSLQKAAKFVARSQLHTVG